MLDTIQMRLAPVRISKRLGRLIDLRPQQNGIKYSRGELNMHNRLSVNREWSRKGRNPRLYAYR
jgi:hypothetical protein